MKKTIAALAFCSAAAIGAATAQTSPPSNPLPPSIAPAPQVATPVAPAPVVEERRGPTENQIADEADARIAQLKADLRLTPEQSTQWSGLQQALREFGLATLTRRYDMDAQFPATRERWRDRNRDQGRDRRRDRDDDDDRDDAATRATPDQRQRPNEIARMRWEANDMAARSASLIKIADAADPIFASFSERQQRLLLRFIQRGFHRGR